MLEIGSWTGLSAEIFAKHFKTVICIDPWSPTSEINTEYDMSEVEAIFDSRINKYSNVIKIKMTSDQYAEKIIGQVDFIYIDGIHEYNQVKTDIENYKNRVKKAICGHDYWPGKFDGVIKAVDDTIGKPEYIFSDTSWIKEIK